MIPDLDKDLLGLGIEIQGQHRLPHLRVDNTQVDLRGRLLDRVVDRGKGAQCLFEAVARSMQRPSIAKEPA